MNNYKGLKKILLVLVTLCALICMRDFVSATTTSKPEDNSYISVTVDGKKYAFEDGDPDCRLELVSSVSYDKNNRVLTLNNFKGEGVEAYVDTEYSTKKFTIKLIGKNYIERSLGENVDRPLIKLSTFGEKIEVEFAGSGSLDFNSKNQAYGVIKASDCNVTINGPVLNFNNCNSGRGGGYPVLARAFAMKSGTVNMEIWPKYHNVESGENYFSYGYAIRALNKIDVASGKLNISYKFPREEYNNENVKYTEGIALGCWIEEPKTNNITLTLDEEIKDYIKLKYEHKLTVRCVKESEGLYGNIYEDVNLVPGIKWDEKTKTLTFDGYDEGQVEIASEKYIEKVKVVVKNSNNMKYASFYKVAESISSGINTMNVDLEFVGDGSLTVSGPINMDTNNITGFNDVSYDPSSLTIDGPHLEISSIWKVNNFLMKSGKLIVKVAGNGRGMHVYDSFNVCGGTLIGRMEDEFYNGDGKDLFIELEEGCTGKVENCVIACTGYVSRVSDNDLCICTYINGEYIKPTNIEMNNVYTCYASSLSYLPMLDISRYKISLAKTEYAYTGKEIRPTVKVAGLIEGEDYVVNYSDNIKIGKAKILVSGVGLYGGTLTGSFDIVKAKAVSNKSNNSASNSASNSKVFKYKKMLYRVVSEAKSGSKYGKVELVGSVNKKCKKITIPKVVKINNKKYRVVSIAKKAFADCKKLQKVIIKSTSIKKIGKKAFAGKKKITIKVPKKKKKAYKKLLKKAKIKCKIK